MKRHDAERNRGLQRLLKDMEAWLTFLKAMGVSSLPQDLPHLAAGFGPLPATLLEELRQKTAGCAKCALAHARHHIVFGEGPADASLVVVGEGPGRDEDLAGRPFVGPSGQLLTKMLKAVEIEREDVFITNIVKCRPPQNRNPEPSEITKCLPLLEEQLKIIKPKVILALGRIAANTLLENSLSIKAMRNRVHYWHNIKVVVTYHPSFLLRQAGSREKHYKFEAWNDLKLLKKEL